MKPTARIWLIAAVVMLATAGALLLTQPAPHEGPIDTTQLLPLQLPQR